jgi:hypothetical protein
MSRRRATRTLLILSASMICVTPAWTTPEMNAGVNHRVDAIWRSHELTLQLRTADRYESCANLQAKITSILEAVGARNTRVKLSCRGLTNNAAARIATQTPVPVTAENVVAATSFDSRTQLAARVRGAALPTPETIERFPAEWRTVSVTHHGPLRLGPSDCELLRSMRDQVLPHLAVRIKKERFVCGGMQPALVVETLTRRLD